MSKTKSSGQVGSARRSATVFALTGTSLPISTLMLSRRAERPVIDAIRDYETDMIDYGFRAVQISLHAMNQAVMEDSVQLMLSRALLRLINCVPPLKRRVFNRMGEE